MRFTSFLERCLTVTWLCLALLGSANVFAQGGSERTRAGDDSFDDALRLIEILETATATLTPIPERQAACEAFISLLSEKPELFVASATVVSVNFEGLALQLVNTDLDIDLRFRLALAYERLKTLNVISAKQFSKMYHPGRIVAMLFNQQNFNARALLLQQFYLQRAVLLLRVLPDSPELGYFFCIF